MRDYDVALQSCSGCKRILGGLSFRRDSETYCTRECCEATEEQKRLNGESKTKL